MEKTSGLIKYPFVLLSVAGVDTVAVKSSSHPMYTVGTWEDGVMV